MKSFKIENLVGPWTLGSSVDSGAGKPFFFIFHLKKRSGQDSKFFVRRFKLRTPSQNRVISGGFRLSIRIKLVKLQ